MQPQEWERVKALVGEALERPPVERARFVEMLAQEDENVRREVESLLASHESAGDFIETPATREAAGVLSDQAEPPAAPSRIGAYRVIGTLGKGGMGSVYLAERTDDAYRKRVAIKVMKRGMDTDEIIRRFRSERQVLAGLDHPHIVRLLDGGTTADGLPYFVMDYVVGETIDEYCRSRRLSLADRLRLFLKVLSAVQSAHRNLVVHRDLKPSNILVTSDGEPKLLDFGIAKVLDPHVFDQTVWETVAYMRPMTPDYASPEQVTGRVITTSSDVYSLGVLLYELLTGSRPYRLGDRRLDEIERAICESQPVRPSTVVSRDTIAVEAAGLEPRRLRRQLQGDLDTILMTAMQKEPQRRYPTVDAFAEDIRRYLTSLPVLARPDSLTYRAGKFARRHRAGLAATVLVLISLAVGFIATVWQARAAQIQRAKAERRFNDVRKLANAYLFEFHDAIANLPGSTPARALVVKRALEYLDSLAAESEDDPTLRAELATAYAKIGDVQWNRYYANLGNTAGALESQRKALAIRQTLFAANSGSDALKLDLASSHALLGDVLVATGDLRAALAAYQQSLQIREEVAARDPANLQLQRPVAISHQRIGDTLGNPGFANLGDTAGALRHYESMQAVFQNAVKANPGDASARHSLSIGHEKIGDVRRGTGDLDGALQKYEASLTIRRELATQDPANVRLLRDLAVAYGKVGTTAESMGDIARARAEYSEMLGIRQRLASFDAADAGARYDLARAHRVLADLDYRQGHGDDAARHYREALALVRALATADRTNTEFSALLTAVTAGLARVQPRSSP